MDWARAKNIVIVALVVTNLFLLVVYGGKYLWDAKQEEDLYQDTMALLQARNIVLNAEIPEEQEALGAVSVDVQKFNVQKLDLLLQQETAVPENQRTRENLIEASDAFLHRAGLWVQGVYVSETETMGNRLFLTYSIAVDGVEVEGPKLYCLLEDGKVASLTGFWVSVGNQGQTEKEILTPVEALLLFAGQQAGNRGLIQINAMELVYRMDAEAMESGETVSDTAFPHWKISYNGGVTYINAYGE